MALSTSKSNHLMPLHFQGLSTLWLDLGNT